MVPLLSHAEDLPPRGGEVHPAAELNKTKPPARLLPQLPSTPVTMLLPLGILDVCFGAASIHSLQCRGGAAASLMEIAWEGSASVSYMDEIEI
jgi:hypothetical protein